MKFRATSVEYWSREGVETVFLGNEESELALTITSVPGTSDHYLEWNDQSNACAGAVRTAQLSGRELKLRLTAVAAKQLGESEFVVEMEGEAPGEVEEVSRRLGMIFGAMLKVKPAPRRSPPKSPPLKKGHSAIKYLNLEGKDLKALPSYVAEMTSLETAKLAMNPRLDFHAVCEVLSKLPVKELTFTTDQPVPENLGSLRHLESLSLDGFTTPKSLPETFGQLENLRYLLIMSDAEVVLPESFAGLRNLAALHMRAPRWSLPSRFDKLSKLEQLDFSNCQFERVPEEMANMSEVTSVIFGSPEERDYEQILRVVARMPNVRSLELNVNPVPKEIGLCRQITELIIWSGFGSTTPLRLPDEFFALGQLEKLLLNTNRFDEIPEAIGRLTGLKALVFIGSDFERLPASVGELSNLTYLNVSENPSLHSLPETLSNLRQLQQLYLDENPRLTRLPAGLERLTGLKEVRLADPDSVANVPAHWAGLFR